MANKNITDPITAIINEKNSAEQIKKHYNVFLETFNSSEIPLDTLFDEFTYNMPCDTNLPILDQKMYTNNGVMNGNTMLILFKCKVALKHLAEQDTWWCYTREDFIAEHQNNEEIMNYYNMFIENMNKLKKKISQ